jgi:dihydrolipoamide dehydrogenase
MSKGVNMLLKKNKIDLIHGYGKLKSANRVEVSGENRVEITAPHVIIATGARPKELPCMPVDEEYVLSYKTALFPDGILKSIVIVGSGAVGVELACFWSSFTTKVTVVELMPNIVPSEDKEVSEQLSRSLRKAGVRVITNSSVNSFTLNEEDEMCYLNISTPKGNETLICDKVVSATGIVANIENLGLENLGVEIENGKIKTDLFYRTNVMGVYAIGDVIATPALAHVASSEAVRCVEKIAGMDVEPIDYNYIPSCIYTTPAIASVGMTEKDAIEAGFAVRTGKFPYTASGKAASDGNRDGFAKLVFDEKNGKLLGAHLIGVDVTEIISGLTLALKLGVTCEQLKTTIYPHPSMSEAVAEAAAEAFGKAIHL